MALVLILNHHPEAAEVLARLLIAAGHQVHSCGRPGQALRRARLLRFDLLWMAVPLVGMEASAFLRRLYRCRPELPVVATAAAEWNSGQLRQLKNLGVRVVLRENPKPHVITGVTAIIIRENRGPES